MLRVALPLGLIGLAACGGDDDPPADALAERVADVLELSGADVTCPDVEDPEAGDRATCTARFDRERRMQVDIEFDADGAFAVVGLVPG